VMKYRNAAEAASNQVHLSPAGGRTAVNIIKC
jgi:hypothetical protein